MPAKLFPALIQDITELMVLALFIGMIVIVARPALGV